MEYSTTQEARYACIDDIGGLLIVVLIYQDKKSDIRIIFARKVVKKERQKYYENFKKNDYRKSNNLKIKTIQRILS